MAQTSSEIVNFADSCNLDGWIGYLLPEQRKAEVQKFQQLYEQNWNGGVNKPAGGGIPKVIHQIWIGGTMPEKFQRQTQMWKDHHPTWDYRLWTQHDLPEFEPEIRQLIEDANCMGQKGDIMRVAILNRFGGLYVDVDYDCYKPCDAIVESADFAVSLRGLAALYMQFRDTYVSPLYCCTSFIGSVPGHPVLQDFLDRIGPNLNDPQVIGTPSRLPLWGKINRMKRAIRSTYNLWHNSLAKHMGQSSFTDLPLPPTYLNPIDNWWKTRHIRPAYYQNLPGFLRSNEYDCKSMSLTQVQPHSFGNHDSNATWL